MEEKNAIKAQVNQFLSIEIEVVVEDTRRYSFKMPYGASFNEAHSVSKEISQAIVTMAENAQKQKEAQEKEEPKEEDAKE